MMTYTTRTEWGAKHGQGRANNPVDELVVHHFYRPDVAAKVSADYEAQIMRNVEHHHAVTNGWGRIGYNFVVFQSGRVYEGCGWRRIGAHTAGKNSSTVGLAFAIDGGAHAPSEAAWQAAAELVNEGVNGGVLLEPLTVSGHRDYSAKPCPGSKVYPHINRLLEHEDMSKNFNVQVPDDYRQRGVRKVTPGEHELRHVARAIWQNSELAATGGVDIDALADAVVDRIAERLGV